MGVDTKKKDHIKGRRLKEAYAHLKRYHDVSTQEDFADKIRRSRTSVCSALNDTAIYLTDGLFKDVCDRFPGIFSLDYLLSGEGELLTPAEKGKMVRIELVKLGKMKHVDVLEPGDPTDDYKQKPARYIRLLRALLWLKTEKGINYQKIAKAMGITQASVTRGVRRVELRNDERFLIGL